MTYSSNPLEDFLLRNGNATMDAFMDLLYECILNQIAYNVCDKIKEDGAINDFKIKAKKRGKNGEVKTAKELFNKFDLSDKEKDYLARIVISFIYHSDRISLDKIRKIISNKNEIKCASCGKKIHKDEIEIDHIFPYSYHGDSLNPINYQTLCRECNQMKSNDALFPLKFLCKTGFFPKYCINDT